MNKPTSYAVNQDGEKFWLEKDSAYEDRWYFLDYYDQCISSQTFTSEDAALRALANDQVIWS